MKIVTCIDLSYTTYKRKSLENSSYFYIFYVLHLNVLYKQPWNLWYFNFSVFLHRELERKVEKVKDMKLEVMIMRPKTKNNMNFQSE